MSHTVQTWVAVGHLDDIPRQGARCLKNGAMTIAVFRASDDRIFAIEDKCPHKGAALSEGIMHGGCVTCPLHNWVISLETGLAQGADEGQVATFATRVENNRVFVAL